MVAWISSASGQTPAFLGQWNVDPPGSCPFGIASGPSGDLYIADQIHSRVVEFTSEGALVRQWGSRGLGSGQFDSPIGVAVDARGNVFVPDLENDRVQEFSGDGTYITEWGNGLVHLPTFLAIDP